MKRFYSSLNASPGWKFVSAMRQSFTLTLFFSLMLAASLFCVGMAWAEENSVPPPPNVYITPHVGPPTTTVFVSGNGFDPFAAVDIYFDTTDLAIVRTDITGAFGTTSPTPKPTMSGVPIVAPKDALPGTHWITAVERDQNKSGQVQFLVRTDWAQFQFSPNHKGVNPYENILNPDNVGGLGVRWSYPGLRIELQPAVANGVVYACSRDDMSLYAFNAGTGAVLWRYEVGYWAACTPTVVKGTVYFATSYAYATTAVYALDANTGKQLWHYQIGRFISGGVAVVNGLVYFGGDPNLYALDAATGKVVWTYPALGSSSTPAVANGVVYFGSLDKNLYALDARNGVLLWKYTTGDSIYSSPAVANGVVYIGSDDNNLYALNATTGLFLWKYTTGGQIYISSPAVANGVVYIGSTDTNLYALNAFTGAVVWRYTTAAPVESSVPVVANGVVYVGSGEESNPPGNLYALNAETGALLWKYDAGYPVRSVAIADGAVYFGTRGNDYNVGNMFAFDLGGSLSPDKLSPPERPDPMLLTPDWSLQPSAQVTQIPNNLN